MNLPQTPQASDTLKTPETPRSGETLVRPSVTATSTGTGAAPTAELPSGTRTESAATVTPAGPPAQAAPTVGMPSVGRIEPGSTMMPRDPNKRLTPVVSAGAGKTLTLENAEAGIMLRASEQFLLDLGDRGWKVRIEDPTIVTLVAGAPAGTQGYFEAVKVGKTNLLATSDPPCRQATPPCGMPSLFLKIPVTVLP